MLTRWFTTRRAGRSLHGLKKENFAVFEDGVKQTISNFATPEAPITVTLVLEYSKWTETFGRASGGYFEPGVYEIDPSGRTVSLAVHQAAERLRFGDRLRHPADADHGFHQ